ncbi:hypothetical protein Scep_004475 [Stephania cephalantha]|uniref:Uncharacterized protein n=1 Tax=Stephania cephalantha TaxID=152367 RepID=A0AAP0PZ51_9MAGN
MEAMASVWSCSQLQSVNELKDMLFYTTVELESVRLDSLQEMRRNEENMKQLLHQLSIARQERDEARNQLQILLNKLIPSSPIEVCPSFPALQPETPPVCPKKGSTSITDSDSLSETYNHQSYGSSSSIDPFLDVVSSTDAANINICDSSNMGIACHVGKQDNDVPISMASVGSSSGLNQTDQASAAIDNLLSGKPLPQQGKLLQAVMEAGTLLQTLLVSGPLPRWRNPPPVQTLQMPPLSIKGCEPQEINYSGQTSCEPQVISFNGRKSCDLQETNYQSDKKTLSSSSSERDHASSSQVYGSENYLGKDTSGMRSLLQDTFATLKRQRHQ